MKPVRILAVICCLSLLLTVTGQSPEPVDTKVIDRIIAAEKTSQVMEIATVLTNTYGPRLTNSANVKGAGEYARKKLVEWQLANVRLETFNFGNGWTNERFTMKLASDPTTTFQAYSKPWTVGTNGPVTAEVVEGVRSQADLTAMKGKLRGKFVLVLPAPPASSAPTTPPPIQRFTDAQLSSMATASPAANLPQLNPLKPEHSLLRHAARNYLRGPPNRPPRKLDSSPGWRTHFPPHLPNRPMLGPDAGGEHGNALAFRSHAVLL